MEIKSGHSLANLNSWKVGGEAEYFCTPSNIDECIEAHNWAASKKLAVTYLGLGSNVLISDKGIKGLVICTRKLKAIHHYEEEGKLKIECMAGNTKMELLKLFLKYELSPALMFAGIPGDIGGGVVMNAGISEKLEPREFEEVVEWVEVLRDGEIHRYQHKDLEWTYRHCHGWEPGMLVKACISWPLEPKTPEIKKLVKEANQTRLKKQPLELPSCGSVFKNPLPQHSGRLIEEAGLKGHSIGGAQVSEKHANFIVNTGNATASEMRSLIELVQKTVHEKFKVQLQTEVRYLGLWD